MIKWVKYIGFAVGISLASVAYGQVTAMADTRLYSSHDRTIRQIPLSDSLLNFAQTYLNTPYRYGAKGDKAFDCSGFSGFVFRNFGYNLDRTAAAQANGEGIEIKKTELQPGDLVFFKGRNAKQQRVGHVGIVVDVDDEGNFKFIHASIKKGVTITESQKDYYKDRFVSAKRIITNDMPVLTIEPLKVTIEPLIIH